jgi:hypothetical protein
LPSMAKIAKEKPKSQTPKTQIPSKKKKVDGYRCPDGQDWNLALHLLKCCQVEPAIGDFGDVEAVFIVAAPGLMAVEEVAA